MLESAYQKIVCDRLRYEYPGCVILKNDSGYQQGIPDWLFLWRTKWAMFEIKRKRPSASDFEPNQEWWLEQLGAMSFSACVYPEVEEEVFRELQQAFRPRRRSRVSES